MIDGFVLSHPPLLLTEQAQCIGELTFNRAMGIARDRTLLPVPLDVFYLTPSAHVQSLQVQLHVEKYLAAMPLPELKRAERILLEVIVLHRLKSMHEPRQESYPKAGRAVAIMGGMIQHRLTQLLLMIAAGQRARLFGLGKLHTLSQMHWEMEFVGASAVVRVIKAAYEIDGTTIRLPTLFEDVDQGIDLFIDLHFTKVSPVPNLWTSHKLNLAVNIKSMNRPERLFAERVLGVTCRNGEAVQQRKILNGAAAACAIHARPFIPVRVVVGRTANTNYEIYVDESEVRILEDLLSEVERSEHTPHGASRVLI